MGVVDRTKKVKVTPFRAHAGAPSPDTAPSRRARVHTKPGLLFKHAFRFMCFLLLASYSVASTSKHIMIVSLSLRGHVVPLARLAAELTSRGHRVSFAVPEDGRDYCNKTGATFVSLGRLPFSLEERTKLRQISHDTSFFRGTLSLINDIYLPNNMPMFKALIKIVKRDRPDLMVVDIGALGGLDVAHLMDIPYVINNPSILFRLDNRPHYVPAWGSGFSQRMTLWERCLSVLYPRLLAVALTPTFMDMNKLRHQRTLSLFKNQHDIFGNSLMMVNTAFGFEYPLSISPLVKMTGPLMPITKPTLPSSISYWLETSTTPVVVVLTGAGSMAYLESWQVKQIAQGLTDTHFRVLWALRSEERGVLGHSLPTTFRIKSNMPQLAVLAHTNVRVVITPCGMASVQEALYYGKTLLCIPILGDQVDVAARVTDSGAGLSLDKTRLEVGQITKSVLTLYRNASFRLAAKRVGKILRSTGGCTTAADVVEMALSKGTAKLLTHARSWHQTSQMDLVAIVFAVAILLLLALRTLGVVMAMLLGYLTNRLWSKKPAADRMNEPSRLRGDPQSNFAEHGVGAGVSSAAPSPAGVEPVAATKDKKDN